MALIWISLSGILDGFAEWLQLCYGAFNQLLRLN